MHSIDEVGELVFATDELFGSEYAKSASESEKESDEDNQQPQPVALQVFPAAAPITTYPFVDSQHTNGKR